MGFSELLAIISAHNRPPPNRSLPPNAASPVEQIERKRAQLVSEAQRVLNLPVVSYDGADLTDELRRPGGTETLRDIQSKMLAAARHHGKGGLFFVGTGHGKALTAILLGSVMPNVDRVVVIAPSSTLINLHKEHVHFRLHFRVHPNITFEGFEKIQQATPEGALDYIEELVLAGGSDPARVLVVFDEAHRLKNLTSARGSRVLRLRLKYPQLRMFMLSGSLTEQSIKECAHLAWMALGDGSPFPCPWLHHDSDRRGPEKYLTAWSECLDKKGEPGPDDWRLFGSLWHWAYPTSPMTNFIGGVRTDLARKAFQHRLLTCPGVVLSRETSLKGTALVLRGLTVTVPEEVTAAIATVENEGMDPDGNVVPDFASAWRVKRQLAQGFFYVWDWPLDASGRPVRDDAWLLARSTWNKHVRTEIRERGTTGYDSALLVYTTVMRQVQTLAETPMHRAWLSFVSRSHKDESPGVVAARERKALAAWHTAGGNDQEFDRCEDHFMYATRYVELWRAWVEWSSRQKHKAKPPTRAVWISRFLIDDLLRRVAEHHAVGESVAIWYDYDEIGEELRRRGIPVFGAGTEPPSIAITCALSIDTHREGKNLQQWSNFYVLCPPAGGTRWEQCLDDETEILTTAGWLRRTDPRWEAPGTEVAAYDVQDESVQWMRATHRVERRLEGESMYGVASDYLNLRVTAGHRMIHQEPKRLSNGYSSGGVWKPRRFVPASALPTHGRFPVAGLQTARGVPLSDADLTFIGLFMTDGKLDIGNNAISLFQSDRYPEIVKLCSDTIQACGFRATHSVYTKPTNFGERGYPLNKWQISYGMPSRQRDAGLTGWARLAPYIDKEMPSTLEDMTQEQLLVLLHAMWLGDKAKNRRAGAKYTKKTFSFVSRRKATVDRIQSICVRRGVRCNIREVAPGLWSLSFLVDRNRAVLRTPAATRPSWRVLPSDPNEMVWCVSVPTGAIVVRREGKVAIVGNCVSRHHREKQLAKVVIGRVYQHVREFREALISARAAAAFVQSLNGNEQKLLIADYQDIRLPPTAAERGESLAETMDHLDEQMVRGLD